MGCLLILFLSTAAVRAENADPPRRAGLVHWVIDGDTFDLDTGERVRLIGVNTPEYRPWKNRVDFYGREASQFSKSLLAGKKILLESDAEAKDRYGRSLAYVYLEDGTFVNRLLAREGFARVRSYPPNLRHQEALQAAQREAKKAGKGLWRPENLAHSVRKKIK